MNKILISACLLGQKVRYDGQDCLQNHKGLRLWIERGLVISICPEMAGGLPTPRPPAEIQGQKTGFDVLESKALLQDNHGVDVTEAFIRGARKTLALAQKHGVRVAILKARSPSCGSKTIYDGSFSGQQISGMGVTAALLQHHDILVFDEDSIEEALVKAESLS